MNTITLTEAEFDALPDYSCTIPTGVIIGKRWKRGEPFGRPTRWFMGEYREYVPPDPEKVRIAWSEIIRYSEFANQSDVLTVCDA